MDIKWTNVIINIRWRQRDTAEILVGSTRSFSTAESDTLWHPDSILSTLEEEYWILCKTPENASYGPALNAFTVANIYDVVLNTSIWYETWRKPQSISDSKKYI